MRAPRLPDPPAPLRLEPVPFSEPRLAGVPVHRAQPMKKDPAPRTAATEVRPISPATFHPFRRRPA
jgi:hypothetical protein